MIKPNLYILLILLFSTWSCSDKGDPISCNDNIDCLGECGGNAQIDECGICGGTGIPDDQCDCDGNILDECGICGGGSSTCISFSNDIQPVLNQYCTNCHGNSGNLSLESYNDMMSVNSVVIPGNHTESSLWTEVNSGSMPKYSPKLDQELINKIANWIDQGALEN